MADKITYTNKVGITPRETHFNQVGDVDMNDIKRVVNIHADNIDAFANGDGKTFTSIALAMAVLPLPSNTHLLQLDKVEQVKMVIIIINQVNLEGINLLVI